MSILDNLNLLLEKSQDAAREKMRQLPRNVKEQLLSQEQMLSTRESDDPKAWTKRLSQGAKVSSSDLRSLGVVLRGQGKSWMSEFKGKKKKKAKKPRKSVIEAISAPAPSGLTNLLALLDPELRLAPGCKYEALRCLRALMNNSYGLNVILETPAAVQSIAGVLTSELLSVFNFFEFLSVHILLHPRLLGPIGMETTAAEARCWSF